jgi:Dolichyl-phosphate-mannose-protein mannosyltransferase
MSSSGTRLPTITPSDTDTPIRPSPVAWALKRLCRPPGILILLVGLLLSRGITNGEPFYNNDETRHVMNGVFLRDLLVDRPLAHPLTYTYEYYAKYPAIAVPHWPPLFYVVEALFFLIFGISVWASRLAILGFALLGAYFWYRIAERYGPRARALLSAFVFCLLPSIMVFESVTMLEIPQVTLCLGTVFFWLRWVENEKTVDLWALAALLVAALLTSQSSIFLVVFLSLDFLLNFRFRLLRNWQVWAALLSSVGIVVPWYLFSFRALTRSYQRAVGQEFQHVIHRWSLLFYLRKLPEQLGLTLLVFACIGIAWSVARAGSRYRFLVLWIVSAYLCFTLINEKESRHIFIWLPPLVYFSLLGIEALVPRRRWVWLAYAAIGLYFLVGALRFQRPQLTGVESAARFVLAQPNSDIIYYQGYLNGAFIFDVRRLDPQKSHMVARDKQVVATNIVYARRPVLSTTDQVLNFFENWGIRYAVIESPNVEGDLAVVHQLVESSRFELIATYPVRLNQGHQELETIAVYRLRGEIRPSAQPLNIPMMTIHRDIPVDLNRLSGRPWPN